MEIKVLEKKDYKAWDSFCLESDDAWFWHTSNWLDMSLAYKPELRSVSHSFMVCEKDSILAICPLLVENHGSIKEFSFGGGYGPVPAIVSKFLQYKKEKILTTIFEHIKVLAERENVSRAKFRFSILNPSFLQRQQTFNFLLKQGFIDTSINTQLIDVRKSIEELHQGLRRRYKSTGVIAPSEFTHLFFDKNTITKEIFSKYQELHYKASGRITRPQITFDLMYESIVKGEAFLSGARKGNSFIGFIYFYAYKKNVYFGSSCNDPEYEKLPISHFLQWGSIKYMNENGYHWYEIGWQVFGTTIFEMPTEKEISISHFKRGFGGMTVPLWRGEKYYDKDFFKEVFTERIERYYETQFSKK